MATALVNKIMAPKHWCSFFKQIFMSLSPCVWKDFLNGKLHHSE
jgi:hypothetical protein